MALNNLTAITGLSSCEKLTKLDLTVNFIGMDTFYDSIMGLKENTFLNELYVRRNAGYDMVHHVSASDEDQVHEMRWYVPDCKT